MACSATWCKARGRSFYNLKSGLGQGQALETAEISTKSALDANILGYQVGVRINLDVLNSQSQLYVTRRDLDLQRYNVLTVGLKLRQAAGVLKPEDLEQINALLVR
jgi:outer membrane protein